MNSEAPSPRAKLLQIPAQLAGEAEVLVAAAEGLHRRARTVPADLQVGHAGKARAPVGELPLQLLPREMPALPVREVRVLDRQLRQADRAAEDRRAVEPREVGLDHSHGPAVRDDVVDDQQQLVVVSAQPHQQGAQERPLGNIEGVEGLGEGEAVLFHPPRHLRQG